MFTPDEIGARLEIERAHPSAQGRVQPGKSLNPIPDEWGNIETEGEALADDLGKLGTWTARGHAAGP